MDCAGCGHENREAARFCDGCGAALALLCDACGTELRADARFCDGCGQQVGGDVAAMVDTAADAVPAEQGTIDGERKQVTVMFVDIVGSMDLAESVETERWRDLMDRFFAVASESVHSVQGTVDKFTGDGVMAIFGAPISYEDHARRACLAALHLHASLAPLALDVAHDGLELAIRVGLNSGEVIVGEIGDEGGMEYTAIGHTVGMAQRMESLAPPGSTALSATTAALVAGEFDLRETGAFTVKGSSVPQQVFELAGKTASRDRVEAAGLRGGLSPFVGREREQSALDAALERAVDGDGQVVGLVGEPGVGKSRLAREFVERCAAAGIAVNRGRAVAHGRDIPLLPILELIRSTLGVGENDDPATARERIVQSLEALDASFEEDLPLTFDFLGVPDPERPAPKSDPEARQRQLLSLVRRFVHARSRIRVAVTLIEDVHWLDDASRVFLAEFVRANAGTRTLLILTYRPEYPAEVLRGSNCEQLSLRPLAKTAVQELLVSLLGTDGSLDGLGDLIAARAVGNPFFCEELVAALAESGHLVGERGSYRLGRTLEEVVLPATVQATLAARIDRLTEREKEVLRIASVIGYELSGPLLRAVCGLPDDELDDVLDALVSAELLIERMGDGGVEYLFKHPLTQEVANRSQLSDRRRLVHRDVARAIEQLYPDRLDELAALVAQHWEAAGEPLAAVRWTARAALWVGLGDMAQALAHWTKVTDLTADLPESPETSGLALLAHIRQLDFGWRLGISEEQAAAHFRVGKDIAQRSGDPLNLLLITTIYAVVRGLSGHIEEYGQLGEQVDRIGNQIGEPAVRVATIPTAIYARYTRGALTDALALAEEGIALAGEDPTLGGGFLGLVCPFAFCLMMKGIVLCQMGRHAEAGLELDRAIAVAREHGDLEIEGWTHGQIVMQAYYTGEPETALASATRSMEIAERIGSAYSGVGSQSSLGVAHLTAGRAGEAISAFKRSMALARRARTGLDLDAWTRAGMSEALLRVGDHAEALAVAEQAVANALRCGSAVFLPNAHRVLAEALLASQRPAEVATAQNALDAAVAAVETTGVRAELPFIERARRRLGIGNHA